MPLVWSPYIHNPESNVGKYFPRPVVSFGVGDTWKIEAVEIPLVPGGESYDLSRGVSTAQVTFMLQTNGVGDIEDVIFETEAAALAYWKAFRDFLSDVPKEGFELFEFFDPDSGTYGKYKKAYPTASASDWGDQNRIERGTSITFKIDDPGYYLTGPGE